MVWHYHEYAQREKYSGARLTPEGETVALEVLRHHRLLETSLAEQLGYDWTEIHDRIASSIQVRPLEEPDEDNSLA